MKKGRVVSLSRFGILDFFRKNTFLLIIFSILIIGIIIGVFLFNKFGFLQEYFSEYITEYINSRMGVVFGKVFIESYLATMSVLFLVFLLGASLFGIVTVPTLVALNGFFQGCVTAHLYSNYGLKGVAFNAIIYIPSMIVFLMVFSLASRESIRFSTKITSLTLSKSLPCNLADDFRDYGIKYIIFAIIIAFSSIIDALLSVGLLKYFTF